MHPPPPAIALVAVRKHLQSLRPVRRVAELGSLGRMIPTRLQRMWRHAAQKRDLKVQMPFVLTLPDGTKLTAEVLLEGYGAPHGMFIVSDYSGIQEHTAAIIAAGFGYTCMSQPSEAEVSSLEGIDACLEDWKDETTA